MAREGLRLRVPGDKSITQRALVLAALADGESRVRGALRGADPVATARALAALGVRIRGMEGGGGVTVRGRGMGRWSQPAGPLDLANSGTGARLLAGALAGHPLSVVVAGDESLSRRPMERVAAPLGRMGATVEHLARPGRLPMRIAGGPLRAIRHESEVASAQVKSAVLLAGLVGGADVEVREPRRSRDHTERMLDAMGARVEQGPSGAGWSVALRSGVRRLAPLDMEVPGDFSSAAFFVAWAALAGVAEPVAVGAVGLNPTRTGLLSAMRRMGARVEVSETRGDASRWGGEPVGDLRVTPGAGELRAVDVGGDEIPGLIDEVPLLAVLAARAKGVTRISGASELRVKESDRLAALAVNLRRVGAKAEETRDGLEIEGTRRRLAGVVESFSDHRIAMAFGVLGATPGCELRIDDREVADVSFPGFWDSLARASAWASRSRPMAGGRALRVEGER